MKRWCLILWLAAMPVARAAGSEAWQSARACEAVRENVKLQAVVAQLEKLAKLESPFWNSYRPESASYIFLVPGPARQSCGVLWRDGKLTTIEFEVAPRMSTPLYGYLTPTPAPDTYLVSPNSYPQPIAFPFSFKPWEFNGPSSFRWKDYRSNWAAQSSSTCRFTKHFMCMCSCPLGRSRLDTSLANMGPPEGSSERRTALLWLF